MAFNQGNTKASKLDGVQVMEIREKYATGLYTYDRLSVEYGVASNTIRSIVKGTSWQNLPGIEPAHVIEEGALRSLRKLDAMMKDDGLPPAVPMDADTLAAMERAVLAIPEPEFIKPTPDMEARLRAYGVRPPPSKPAIQAQPVQDAQRGAMDGSAAPERGAASLPIGCVDEGCPHYGTAHSHVDPTNWTTEEAGK